MATFQIIAQRSWVQFVDLTVMK